MNKKLVVCLICIASLFCVEVSAQQQPVAIKADVIEYDSSTGISTANGNVVITQEDGEARGASAQYNVKTDQGWLAGGVTAQKGTTTLSADKLWILSRNHVAAEGSAHVNKAGDSLSAYRLDYWADREFVETSGGWAKLVQSDGSVLTAVYMNYDMKKGVAVAERNVEISSPPRKLTAAGDKAVYTSGTKEKPGDIVLTGNAWAIQDGNRIAGNVLTIKSDSSQSEAKGNVKMVIVPKDEPPKGGPGPEEKGGAKGTDKEDGKTPGQYVEKPQERPVWQPPGKP